MRRRYQSRRWSQFAVAALVLVSACAQKPRTGEAFEPPPPEPVAIVVRNENFLDMTVSIVSGSMTRRLGNVTGNGRGEFSVGWSAVSGQTISLMASAIGSTARVRSNYLTINPGQVIEFRIGSVITQSAAVVRDP